MLRIVVCSAALIAVIVAIKYGLKLSLSEWGFWPYMAICLIGSLVVFFIAHLIDRADTRSREVQPPRPPGFR
jgi:TRAP-type C4-dicarboxylate transport system permease small subunit